MAATLVQQSPKTQSTRLKPPILAPKPPSRNRWRLPPPTPSSIRRSLPGRPFPLPSNSLDQPRRNRQGKLALFLRVLFGPHASRRAQSRLWGFRYETIPALRHRAQARVYRAIVNRQAKLAQRRASGRRGIVGFLTATRRRLRGTESPSQSRSGRVNNSSRSRGGMVPSVDRRRNNSPLERGCTTAPMSQYLPSSSSAPGGRRKKVFEYLKAANELRQSYAAQWTQQRNGLRDYDEDYFNTPGAFPDVEIARSGDEEMVIFPSYARRLVKGVHHSRDHSRRRRDSTSTIDEYRGGSEEAERGLADWEVIEDENAIVAVDVRGWVYAPHRGPMTRKHRLMIALARKLSGVPAPNNPSNEAEEPNAAAAVGTTHGGREDEIVDTEAQSIIRKAEGRTDTGLDDSALPGRPLQKTSTSTSLESIPMSKDELSVANAHLMERLRPFLTNPVTQMPVTVFFFNDGKSQSRSIMTDESGHFMLRAALPFVPTHVRVLASEELSAVKEVQIIEPTGVSLISDVDDTIKHSAIASGAKEIFRNTFVRELAELTIHGVAEWYNKLAKMGVEVHYVSNAPWQLYPLLDRYFKLVGLPPGSVHLKQYSGMLQGIFEPTAERKRGPLEQILRDFPERKFILVGDSGEADLEVYTDIALANPGRILGVFIRDITTSDRKRFFDKSVEHLDNAASRSRSTPHLHDDSDTIARRPTLPPRRAQGSPDSAEAKQLDNADLIDLRDEEELRNPPEEALKPPTTRTPPAKPSKPSSLRTVSTNSELENGSSTSLSQDGIKRKPVPPLPARRGPQAGQALSETGSTISLPTRPKPSSDNSSIVSQDTNDQRPPRTKQAPPPPPPRRSNTAATTSGASIGSTQTSSPRPPPPPQKPPQSYPAAAATAASAALQYASDRLPWAPSPSNLLRTTTSNSNLRNSSDSQDSDSQSGLAYPSSAVGPLPNRREETWRRRWERAHDLLADHGVVLGSWREGKDVQDVSIWLVEEALKEAKRNVGGGGRRE